MDNSSFIARIEMRIAELGMTKAEFYEKSKISSATFSQWNTGLFSPSRKKIEAAASALGVSSQYLLSGKEAPENKKTPADPKTSEEVDEYIRSLDDPAELMRIMELALKRQRELGGK